MVLPMISLQFNFGQSLKVIYNEWSIFSLNNILGLVGGIAGILWMVLGFILGGYEAFY